MFLIPPRGPLCYFRPFMLLSQTCQHGLRAVLYIATQQDEAKRPVPISRISAELDISFHYLTKTLRKLTDAGILSSTRGPTGGVRLAKPLSELTALDIVQVLSSHDMFNSCVLGLDGCGNDNPCPLHEHWGGIRDQLRDMFSHSDLETVRTRIQSDEFRIVE